MVLGSALSPQSFSKNLIISADEAFPQSQVDQELVCQRAAVLVEGKMFLIIVCT
jgi:hypothetical protein